MPSSDTDIDIELLQEYAKSRADELFTALVEGHIDLVFSAALRQGDYVISEKRVVDPEYDRIWRLGPSGYRNDDPRQKENDPIIEEVLNAYRAANDGRTPSTREDLLPYIKTPAQKQAFHQLIEEPSDKNSTNRTAK